MRLRGEIDVRVFLSSRSLLLKPEGRGRHESDNSFSWCLVLLISICEGRLFFLVIRQLLSLGASADTLEVVKDF